MNISTFMGDGVQKEKLKQIELLGEISKEDGKFQSILAHRMNAIKPIMHFWKIGKAPKAF